MSTLEVKAIQAPTGYDLQMPAGHILQTVSTTKTDTWTYTGANFQDVTGLSATITPTSSSSKILVGHCFIIFVQFSRYQHQRSNLSFGSFSFHSISSSFLFLLSWGASIFL